jgi:hypothetical protein
MKIDHAEATDNEWLAEAARITRLWQRYDAILREEELKIRAEAERGTIVLQITSEVIRLPRGAS